MHTETDAKIVAAIREGATKFHNIGYAVKVWDRKLDRRLQALRRKGLIAYAKGHWHVVEPQA